MANQPRSQSVLGAGSVAGPNLNNPVSSSFSKAAVGNIPYVPHSPFPIGTPFYPLSLLQYAIAFFAWVGTYAYAVFGIIVSIAVFLVTITLVLTRFGVVINNVFFIPLEIQIFSPAIARANMDLYTQKMAQMDRLRAASARQRVQLNAMYWMMRWIWVIVYCFLVLMKGAFDSVIALFDQLGLFVLFLFIWSVWTSATFNYPLALNFAASATNGAERITNFGIFTAGLIFRVGNAILPIANGFTFAGVTYIQITVVEASNFIFGGADSNPLFQPGSVFSEIPNMIAITSNFGGRRLEARPLGDVLLETINQIALAIAFVNGIIFAISQIIYNLVFVLVFSILQGNIDIFIAAIQSVVCAFMSLPCILPEITQYIINIGVSLINTFATFFTVTIDLLGVIPDADPLTAPSVACSGGILASVPCSCSTFFTQLQQCGTSVLECRERDGVFYEYRVYPDGREALMNQGVDRATVCPNTRRLSEDYHGFLEDHVGRYVPCMKFKMINVTYERCSDHLYADDDSHGRHLRLLNIQTPVSTRVSKTATMQTAESSLTDRLAKTIATHGENMNRAWKSDCDFGQRSFDYVQMACYVKLATYAATPVIQRHINEKLVESAPKPHGRKLSEDVPAIQRLRAWGYTFHAIASSIEIRSKSGRSLSQTFSIPKHVTQRIARRLHETNAHVEIPHFHLYSQTGARVYDLIQWLKSFPDDRTVRRNERRLIATKAPTFPKYGIWTGKQCPENTYKCPTDDCVVSRRNCPPPTTNSWSQNVAYQWLQLQIYLEDLDPQKVLADAGRCWRNYLQKPSTNPFLLTHFLSQDPNVNRNFVYCFPLVEEIDPSFLPDYVSWDLYEFVEGQCAGGECQCNGYWASVFETDVDVIPGVPYFTVANLVNGLLVGWTLTCQILFAPGAVFSFVNALWQAILFPFYSWRWVSIPVYYAWWDQGQGNIINGVYEPASLAQILTCAIYNFGYFGYIIVVAILFRAFLLGVAKAVFVVLFELFVQVILAVQILAGATRLDAPSADLGLLVVTPGKRDALRAEAERIRDLTDPNQRNEPAQRRGLTNPLLGDSRRNA